MNAPNVFLFSGEYPPEPGGDPDHTQILALALLERNLPTLVGFGGNGGLAMEDGNEVHRVAGRFQRPGIVYFRA